MRVYLLSHSSANIIPKYVYKICLNRVLEVPVFKIKQFILLILNIYIFKIPKRKKRNKKCIFNFNNKSKYLF